jgi:ABC-type antimicrobial peptide transport system permease subunit
MEDILDRAAARSRFVMSVLTVFALVAVVLGTIGIYGVISYSVALRVREIGIRRALGAGGGAVVMMVLRQGMVLAFTGVGLGLAAAAAGTRLFAGFLHDVEATDPFTYVLVGLGTLLVASLATYLPARGAGGVDPLEALRIE